MMDAEFFLVGGAVRDKLLGLPVHDYDFTVIGPKSFQELDDLLVGLDFKIFNREESKLTIRAHFPAGWTFSGEDVSKLSGDFVLARKESGYSDGRRPDVVEVGTLYDDLARRDFTVNAIAMDEGGRLVDPFNGQRDIAERRLVAVGGAERSFTDDALRAMRALRFSVTKNLRFHTDLWVAFDSAWLPPLLAKISIERRAEELTQMLHHNTLETLGLLAALSVDLREAVFAGNLKLAPTTRRKIVKI